MLLSHVFSGRSACTNELGVSWPRLVPKRSTLKWQCKAKTADVGRKRPFRKIPSVTTAVIGKNYLGTRYRSICNSSENQKRISDPPLFV